MTLKRISITVFFPEKPDGTGRPLKYPFRTKERIFGSILTVFMEKALFGLTAIYWEPTQATTLGFILISVTWFITVKKMYWPFMWMPVRTNGGGMRAAVFTATFGSISRII